MMMSRRLFLAGGVVGLAAIAVSLRRTAPLHAEEKSDVMHSDDEWRKLLSPQQYAVLRQADTEYPFTSPLLHEKRRGTFVCAGCAHELFSSITKFESHTGWPSFWQPLDNAVRTSLDDSFGGVRTEVHCGRCGGHLGHVFDDGPAPTGLRYCMNGIALKFKPASS